MATTDGERLTLNDVTIVDTDSHVDEQLDDLMPYIQRTNTGVTRFLEGATDMHREIYSSWRVTPAFNQTDTQVKKSDSDDDLVHDASSPERKHTLMEKFDIDYSILTPGGSIRLSSVNHDQTALALANAYNSWLIDTFLDDHDDFRGAILAANQKPDLAAEEIDRLGEEDDVVGVQLPATGLVPPAGHHMYAPIYEAAQDHGLPVLLHGANSSSTAAFPVQRNWAETFMEDHAFTFPAESMWHLISMICRGIPEQYPNLEFVMQEAGVEWLPWMMWRLDDHYLQSSQDVPILEKYPSEYIKDQFMFTSQPLGHTENMQHLGSILEAAGGSETVMFATDHPHPDFDPPEEFFRPISGYFDADAVRGMMGGIAEDIFDLP